MANDVVESAALIAQFLSANGLLIADILSYQIVEHK